MSHHKLLSTALTLTLAATTLPAQTPSRILGTSEFGTFLAQIDPLPCGINVCNPALGPAVNAYAGGTAHDPRDRMTWISDGIVLTKVDPRTTCNTSCPPFVAPLVVPGVEVTGLAVNEETQQLFISYSDNRIATFTAIGCSLTLNSVCTVPAPPNHIVSGLATDDASGLLYYATSPWAGPSSVPTGRIHQTLQTSPCTTICFFDAPGCQGIVVTEITGLGYDGCTGELHVTDGQWVYSYAGAATCSPNVVACCPPVAILGERLTGLCVLPSTETRIGNNCTGGTAPVCTSLRHELGGDPTIGNLGFSLDLWDAPYGSFAYCFIGAGPCTGGSTYGVLCNNLMPTFFLSFHVLPTGTGCGASASSPFPIPNAPSLCGIILSSQFVGEIPPSWSGNFTTNCLSWMISSS